MNGSPVARRQPALGEAAWARENARGESLVRTTRPIAPCPLFKTKNDERENNMQGIDVFLNTYVRLDEGTAVLVCAQRSCARTAAWLYSALVGRGALADAFCFDVSDIEAEALATASIAMLRAHKGVRRVAVIVCEPEGPSLKDALTTAQGDRPEKTPIFRVSGRTSGIFELGMASPATRQRSTGLPETSFSSEAMSNDYVDMEQDGLSDSDIEELLAHCDSDMDDLEDHEMEEIGYLSMNTEEIGSLSDEELAALAELEDSELCELASTWGEEGFRVLA